MTDPYANDVAACRVRQGRLLAVMQQLRVDLAVITDHAHIQYLVGPRFAWTFSSSAALRSDGHLTLIAPAQPDEPLAADEVLTYEAKSFSTLRNDQRRNSSRVLLDALGKRAAPRRLGIEFSCCGPEITARLGAELVDLEPELYTMRRRKDPDELARLRKAIAGTAAMHKKAREIIEPGINELDVFNELQAAAVRECGEMLTGTGNDYACGAHEGRAAAQPAGPRPASCTFSTWARHFAATSPTTRASPPWAESPPMSSSGPGSTFCRSSK